MLNPSLQTPENNLCVLGEHSWNMTSQQSPHGALGMYKNMEVTCSIICFLAQHVTTKQHHRHHGSSAICIEISVCANQINELCAWHNALRQSSFTDTTDRRQYASDQMSAPAVTVLDQHKTTSTKMT